MQQRVERGRPQLPVCEQSDGMWESDGCEGRDGGWGDHVEAQTTGTTPRCVSPWACPCQDVDTLHFTTTLKQVQIM